MYQFFCYKLPRFPSDTQRSRKTKNQAGTTSRKSFLHLLILIPWILCWDEQCSKHPGQISRQPRPWLENSCPHLTLPTSHTHHVTQYHADPELPKCTFLSRKHILKTFSFNICYLFFLLKFLESEFFPKEYLFLLSFGVCLLTSFIDFSKSNIQQLC